MTAGKHTGLLLTILVSLLMLTACGFRLRGEVSVPPVMRDTYIQAATTYSELYFEVKSSLERANARIVDTAKAATATLILTNEIFKRRVLTVDAQGRASEYELTYSVNFELRDKDGKVLVPVQTVNLLRDYKFDPDNVLAKDTEEATLRKSLVTFAVQQMMRRINAGLKNPVSPTSNTNESKS